MVIFSLFLFSLKVLLFIIFFVPFSPDNSNHCCTTRSPPVGLHCHCKYPEPFENISCYVLFFFLNFYILFLVFFHHSLHFLKMFTSPYVALKISLVFSLVPLIFTSISPLFTFIHLLSHFLPHFSSQKTTILSKLLEMFFTL